MKRGQAGRIFVFILFMIILAAIVLFGYSMITKTKATISKTELLQLKTNLRNDIDSLAHDYGSVKVRTYNIPKGISEVCFVDYNQDVSAGLEARNPIVAEGVEEKKNLFLIGDDRNILATEDIGPLEVAGPGYVCFPVKAGLIKFNLQGTGTGALIDKEFIYHGFGGEWIPIEELGISFKVPMDGIMPNTLLPTDITLEIQRSDTGLSDKLIFKPLGTRFTSEPLQVKLQVPTGKQCETLVLSTGYGDPIDNPDCSDELFAIFDITEI